MRGCGAGDLSQHQQQGSRSRDHTEAMQTPPQPLPHRGCPRWLGTTGVFGANKSLGDPGSGLLCPQQPLQTWCVCVGGGGKCVGPPLHLPGPRGTHGMRLSLGSARMAPRSRSAPVATSPSCPLSLCRARYQLLPCGWDGLRKGTPHQEGGPGPGGTAHPTAQGVTSTASMTVTTSPLWNASSPALGLVWSCLVTHCVPAGQCFCRKKAGSPGCSAPRSAPAGRTAWWHRTGTTSW